MRQLIRLNYYETFVNYETDVWSRYTSIVALGEMTLSGWMKPTEQYFSNSLTIPIKGCQVRVFAG